MWCKILIQSIPSCQWASNSVYYLLGLWSRLVSSVPYLKGDAPSLLDEFVPKITESFITSRFNSVQVFPIICAWFTYCLLRNSRLYVFNLILLSMRQLSEILFVCFLQAGLPDDLSENPLDNAELLQDQLDCFPYLCRFQVSYIFLSFLSFFDERKKQKDSKGGYKQSSRRRQIKTNRNFNSKLFSISCTCLKCHKFD